MPGKYINNTVQQDNTYNVVKPIYKNIEVKKKDTPQRKENESAKVRASTERAKVTPANPRQASIGPYREKTTVDKAAGRLYAAAEQRAKDAQDKEAAGVVLNALLKPIMPSTYVDIYDAYKKGEVNNVTDALAVPYVTSSWSQRNPDKALVTDLAVPFIAYKTLKGVKFINRLTKDYKDPTSLFNKNMRVAFGNDVDPFGYDVLDTSNFIGPVKAIYNTARGRTIKQVPVATYKQGMQNRKIAFRKYLGVDNNESLGAGLNHHDVGPYRQLNNGNYTVNLTDDDKLHLAMSYWDNNRQGLIDTALGNHGGMGFVKTDDGLRVLDDFDLQPFKGIKWFPKKLRNFEVSQLVPGAKPFRFETHIPNNILEEAKRITDTAPVKTKAVLLPKGNYGAGSLLLAKLAVPAGLGTIGTILYSSSKNTLDNHINDIDTLSKDKFMKEYGIADKDYSILLNARQRSSSEYNNLFTNLWNTGNIHGSYWIE